MHSGDTPASEATESPASAGTAAGEAEAATISERSTAEDNAASIAEKNEFLRLLKQPDVTDMMMEASKRITAGAGAASPAPAPATSAESTTGRGSSGPASTGHAFWDTQPVPKLSDVVTQHGPIDADKPLSEIRPDPYPLPDGFEWCTIDVRDAGVLLELYNLLAENYVEDDDNTFRFNYSQPFLSWALTPPGYFPDWIVGVRTTKARKLVASITGVPARLRVHGREMLLCEINFLCVHKRLRSKRLAPVLIKEVTRRVNLQGIFQAAYTAGVVLPKPVASCKYWHRTINPKKLIDIGFTRLQHLMTMARTIRLYALPDAPRTPGMRPLEGRDVPAACKLLNEYLEKFALHPHFTEAEFAHALLPRTGVVDAYVVEGAGGGGITGLTSFYHLPSSVLGNARHSSMHAVYSFYNVPGPHGMAAILNDALILAKQKGADVFNCLDLMENSAVLRELKFGPGDGSLQYYLYNWQCPPVSSDAVGLVLL